MNEYSKLFNRDDMSGILERLGNKTSFVNPTQNKDLGDENQNIKFTEEYDLEITMSKLFFVVLPFEIYFYGGIYWIITEFFFNTRFEKPDIRQLLK